MTQGLPFDRTTISQHVPIASGVYGLYQSTLLIYVGESNDLRHRLAEHLTEVGTCIEQCGASHFVYELVDARARIARQCTLIRELKPKCNNHME